MVEPLQITYAKYFQDVLGLQVVPLFGPMFGPGGGICRCRDGASCDNAGKHPRAKFKDKPSRLPSNIDNYAVVLGPYVVVDVDDRSVIDDLEAVMGYELPPTWTINTAHGCHMWFRHDEPLATRIGRYPKVDLKSGNTYVVGPGSTSVSGVMYEPINNLPIATAPEQLVRACGRPSIASSVKVTREIPEVTSVFAQASVQRICDEMLTTPTRNNTLHRNTCLLLRSGWAGKDAIVQLAAAAAQAGLTAEEISRTIDSAWNAVMA